MIPDLSQQALQTIAAYLPIFGAPNFQFTGGASPVYQAAHGSLHMLGYRYDDQVSNLIHTADQLGWIYQDEQFQWPEWLQTAQAQALHDDPAALAQATPRQLAQLLTVFARQERFCEGTQLAFWESGLLLGLLRRADVLTRQGETSPLR
ncbi:DUF6508 domain-containing protein [Deinococcus sp. PESE-13]